VRKYTPTQTRWFLQAIDDERRTSHADQVVAARVAQLAEPAAVKDYLKQLQRTR
jgi:hypothetical protein